jgi:hypothetical protein
MQYVHVYCTSTYIPVCDFQGEVVGLTGALCVYIYNEYVQILIHLAGENACTYTHVCACISVHIIGENTCTYIRLRCSHGCFEFTCTGAGLCTFAVRSCGKFVARQRKCRQRSKFNQIRSARLISELEAATWTGAPGCALKCHGNLGYNGAVPWQSW